MSWLSSLLLFLFWWVGFFFPHPHSWFQYSLRQSRLWRCWATKNDDALCSYWRRLCLMSVSTFLSRTFRSVYYFIVACEVTEIYFEMLWRELLSCFQWIETYSRFCIHPAEGVHCTLLQIRFCACVYVCVLHDYWLIYMRHMAVCIRWYNVCPQCNIKTIKMIVIIIYWSKKGSINKIKLVIWIYIKYLCRSKSTPLHFFKKTKQNKKIN